MQEWLIARSSELLADLDKTMFMDDTYKVKQEMIIKAIRETSIEMFHRAAEKSRKNNREISDEALRSTIAEANDVKSNEKTKSKIKIKSSILRRIDSF